MIFFHQCGLGYPGPPGIPGPRGFPGSRGFDGKIETLFLFLFFSDIFICIFSVWIRSVQCITIGPRFDLVVLLVRKICCEEKLTVTAVVSLNLF